MFGLADQGKFVNRKYICSNLSFCSSDMYFPIGIEHSKNEGVQRLLSSRKWNRTNGCRVVDHEDVPRSRKIFSIFCDRNFRAVGIPTARKSNS